VPGRRCPGCDRFGWDKGRAARTVLTAAGAVRLERLYLVCPRCRTGRHPLDGRLGLEGFVSPQAKKLLCLAGASWSFARAADHLQEFCGLRTCDQTIRQVCQAEAGAMADWRHADLAAGAAFAAAAGAVEFQTDGTMVNTTRHGWREMRLGVFAKRPPGRPAAPAEWDTRRLPAPTARVLFAAVETAAMFGPRLRRWAGRLGIRDPAAVTVLADGAAWIWRQAQRQLPGAAGVLDIYHACEHIAACAATVYGEHTAAARDWLDRGRAALLGGGGAALAEWIAGTRRQVRSPPARRALEGLAGYFAGQAGHLTYAERLAAGQSIGTGLVEGACKQVIGRRLKQTGARWGIRRVNRMATLCCTFHSDTWTAYWKHRLP
jgi:hypothetical protein